MPKYSVHFARFPYGRKEDPAVTDWLVRTVQAAKADPRVGAVTSKAYDDTPITMTRNLACRDAAYKLNADYLLMVDSDMGPDCEIGYDAIAKPFWDVAFNTLVGYGRPAVIAAPYCGPPPFENIFVFQWGNRETDAVDFRASLDQLTREDAARRSGIEEVAALPTGLILIDVRALKALWQTTKKPWFDYEMDAFGAEKQTTEDVYFSRNLALCGVPQLCAWDCWAAHHKTKLVRKPRPLTMSDVREGYRAAIAGGIVAGEKLIMVGDDKPHTRFAGILGDAAIRGLPLASPTPQPYKAEAILG